MTRPYIVFGKPCLNDEDIAEVVDSLQSGWIGTGPKVARLESLLQDYTGAPYVTAVNSCTAALHLSLIAAGVGPGDEVITTSMTFAATANAIVHSGAVPVLVDCEPDSELIDLQAAERAITSRTKAIIPVHLAGRICDMDAVADLARRYNLVVIEDAAHALEGRWRNRKIGSISDFTCFSFYVTKNVTTGEGGAVAARSSEATHRIRSLALHGLSRNAWQRFSDQGYRHYQVTEAGFKYNMMDVQAAIGLHQLERAELALLKRTEIWEQYDAAFASCECTLPAPAASEMRHARHLYKLRINEDRSGLARDEFMRRMHEAGIGTGVHYVAVHLQPYYQSRFGWSPDDFPHATRISRETVSLPLSPCLDDDEVDYIIASVTSVLRRARAQVFR